MMVHFTKTRELNKFLIKVSHYALQNCSQNDTLFLLNQPALSQGIPVLDLILQPRDDIGIFFGQVDFLERVGNDIEQLDWFLEWMNVRIALRLSIVCKDQLPAILDTPQVNE